MGTAIDTLGAMGETILMPKSGPRIVCALLAAGILLVSGCRKSAENGPTSNPQNAPAMPRNDAPIVPVREERHHRMFASGISPLIISMSPDTIPFHDGHAPMARYSLTYEIDNSERATKAYISVYAPGVGEVQRFDVDVQPRATIEFLLDATNFDLGPTVRFRAHCPYGDTDWFVMGSDPMPYPQINSTSQIGNVVPAYVQRGHSNVGGVPITIAGSKFTRECTPETQVDGSNVELQNVVAIEKRISGLLPFDALQGRPVVVRHLEVQLVVYGPGYHEPTTQATSRSVYTIASSAGTSEDIYNLNFAEQ
jgi:hypothetical protein